MQEPVGCGTPGPFYLHAQKLKSAILFMALQFLHFPAFFKMDTLSSETGSVTCIVYDTDMYKLNTCKMQKDFLAEKWIICCLSLVFLVFLQGYLFSNLHVGKCFSFHSL